MAEDGSEQPFLMGCYGVGISRTMAAIVEQHNDENGIAWPFSVAPAHVCVLPLTVGDDEVQPAAEKLAGDLAKLGLEVVIDDRKERAGVKFADADLVGWPLQVVVGKRGLEMCIRDRSGAPTSCRRRRATRSRRRGRRRRTTTG